MKKQQQQKVNRPNYFSGQLLLEDDFRAEQSYHINARRRHSFNLHGAGVVHGLEVIRRSESSVTIKPGYAINELGQEIFFDSEEELQLKEFAAKDLVNINLIYQDNAEELSNDATETNRIEVLAVLKAGTVKENESEILLAKVQLDEKGKVGENSIDYKDTIYAGAVIRPGSIAAVELSSELTTGWITLQFRPYELENVPKGESEIPPCFRVGPSETITPRSEKTGESIGAAGTMAIQVPFATNKIKRFRIAGARNEGKITLLLIRGGWDIDKKDHASNTLLNEEISGAPYNKTYEIKDTDFDSENQTISVRISCDAKTAISLIAVEVTY